MVGRGSLLLQLLDDISGRRVVFFPGFFPSKVINREREIPQAIVGEGQSSIGAEYTCAGV
jgi:hypothetical protein